MSGSEGDGYKSEGRAQARPLLFLCSSAGSFSCMAVQREVFPAQFRERSEAVGQFYNLVLGFFISF